MVDVQTRDTACTRAIPARYVLAILASIGMAIVYGLKVNLGVAMVGMVKNAAVETHNTTNISTLATNSPLIVLDECSASDNTDSDNASSIEGGTFEWSGSIQGALKSAYFWGYLVAQIPGGRIAELFSAKWVMFFSVAINVICTLLSPICAKLHYGMFLFMRVLEGIGGGVTFPAMHVMLASWAPPIERSVMSSIVYAGTALGTVIFTLVTGLIAAQLGWEAIFYIQGAASAVWLPLWLVLIADSPLKQTLISERERNYIVSSLRGTDEDDTGKVEDHASKPPFPWKAVFTSVPFWAILVAHTCSNWGWYMVLIELPNYMKSVLKLKIAQNALLSALPFLTMWIFSLVLSKTLDTLRSKRWITTTTARKTATAIASVGPLICFLALCYIGCMRTIAIVLMTVAITTVAGMYCGYLSNHIDIAPNFAGTLIALTNTVATIPGIIVPIFVGHLTDADPSIHSWRIVFWVTIVLYIIEVVVFCLFASGEEQVWNKYNRNEPGEEQPLKSTQKVE